MENTAIHSGSNVSQTSSTHIDESYNSYKLTQARIQQKTNIPISYSGDVINSSDTQLDTRFCDKQQCAPEPEPESNVFILDGTNYNGNESPIAPEYRDNNIFGSHNDDQCMSSHLNRNNDAVVCEKLDNYVEITNENLASVDSLIPSETTGSDQNVDHENAMFVKDCELPHFGLNNSDHKDDGRVKQTVSAVMDEKKQKDKFLKDEFSLSSLSDG